MSAVGETRGAARAKATLEAIYPLSPLQHGMLYQCLVEPDRGLYVQQLSHRLQGELDLGALQRAWERVVERHPVLRSSIVWEGRDEPLQVVHRQVELPWEELDWSGLDPAEQERRLIRMVEDDARRGFDWKKPPLLRLALIDLGDRRHQVLLTYHHLVMDGWSTAQVQGEVGALYRALAAGRDLSLGPARPYQEHIAWLAARDPDASESYWRRTLEGFDQPTPLGVDRPPAARVGSGLHGRTSHRFSDAAADALDDFARRRAVTPATVCQAAWGLVLARHVGCDDVVYGFTVSGRPPSQPGTEQIVGLFINTLPVRLRLPADRTVATWLRELHLSGSELAEHQHTPLPKIRRWSDVPADRPLFESLLVFENFPVREAPDGGESDPGSGLSMEGAFATERPDVPLTVAVMPGRGARVELFYDRRRFDPTAVARLARQMDAALGEIARSVDETPADLAPLGRAERHQLVAELNDSRALRSDLGIWTRIERCAARWPEAVALELDGDVLTYGELVRRVEALAGVLAGAGVGPEVQVGVLAERTFALLVALLGIWRAGGAYVPLDPELPAERLGSMLDRASVDAVVTHVGIEPPPPVATRRRISLDADGRLAAGVEPAPVPPAEGADDDRLAYVLFTSGSTGVPKGVMVPHGGIRNRLEWIQQVLPLGPEDAVLQKTPFGFDVSVGELFWPLMNGARLVLARPGGHRDSRYLAELVTRRGITSIHFVPSMLGVFLDEPDLPRGGSLRWVLASGEALTPAVVERFFERLDVPLVNLYGPTEASIEVSWWRLDPGATRRRVPSVVPIGRPVDNCRLHVTDRSLSLAPRGVVGELVLGGRAITRGYLRQPALTAEQFVPDPFGGQPGERLYKTGDLARHGATGEVEFLGRFDHQVKIRGHRIELEEIEVALAARPEVADVRVLDWPAGSGGRRLVAFVVPSGEAPTAPEALARLMTDHAASRLPSYMVPAAVEVLERLPLTLHGKLDRAALPEPGGGAAAAVGDRILPRTPAETVLAAIWSDLLGLDAVGVTDNFFGLGGDSILALQVVSRARREGLALAPHQLFEEPTIEALAAVAGAVETGQPHRRAADGPVAPTPIQHWFFDQELVDRHRFNQALFLAVDTPLERRHLGAACRAVADHHEALRLRFRTVNGAPRQEPVAPGGPAPVAWVDLSGLTPERLSPVLEGAADQVQGSLHLERGPLWRAVAFEPPPGEVTRLLLVAHHLVTDGVSWRVLTADLAAALDRLEAGDPVELPPPTTPLRLWAEHLYALARSPEIVGQLDVWASRPAAAARFRLPLDRPAGDNLQRSTRTLSVHLGRERTEALLRRVPAAYGTRVDEVLLAALVRALCRWAGSDGALVDLEGHGRDQLLGDHDLTRTVGWLTTLWPVALEAPADDRPESWLKDVKEQLRTVPHRGLGHGLLRYLHPDPAVGRRLAELATPEVVFNYLGRIESGDGAESRFRLAAESSGASQSRRARRAHRLGVSGGVFGGELRMDWVYSASLHDRSTLRRLADDWAASLDELIDCCLTPGAYGRTPSDFPLSRLGRERLDHLVERLGLGIEDVYPLSPMQEGMLFHTLMEPSSGVFVTQTSWRLEGPLDPRALEAAWGDLVARHTVLRTAFWVHGDEPHQAVLEDVAAPFAVHDLWQLDADGQERRLTEELATDRSRGFDVERPPLARLALLRLADDVHQVVWSHHHLLLDGWSIPLLLNDLLALYAARLQGSRRTAPRPRPYREYIAWLADRDPARSEAFWRRFLDGFDTPTPLATPASAGDSGALQRRLAPEITDGLDRLAREHGLTLGTLVQGGWALVLGRLTGRRDVVFGSPVSGRPPDLVGAEELVGLLINTLPVRGRWSGDESLLFFLHQLQSRQARSREHEHTPVTEVRGWSELARGEELFDHIVIVENYPRAMAESPAGDSALTVRSSEVREQANYPFALEVRRQGATLQLKARYDGTGVSAREAEEAVDALVRVLGTMVEDPDSSAGDLEAVVVPVAEVAIDGFNDDLELDG